MKEIKRQERKICVIGHKNPDTDSICSAVAYAELKNRLYGPHYEACCAGEISRETEFLLDKYQVKAPRYCADVYAQVRDIGWRAVEGVDGRLSLREAWEIMRNNEITTLPVVTPDRRLSGIISLKDVAMANIDVLDSRALSAARTALSSVVKTLDGQLLVGEAATTLEQGKVAVGAGSPEVMEALVEPGDLVILANRYEAQLCAIELGAVCIVVTMAPSIAKTIIKLAEERNCAIISTAYDTFTASRLINQSVPVEHYMLRDNIISFTPDTPVEEVKKIMAQVRVVYFPILDEQGRYLGMISRRNLLNLARRQLILVDHNERAQCVEGYEEAEILEVIDHHRLGTLETTAPLYFRNEPVGCTATIIDQMYREQGVPIEPALAGLLCGAILSDTLMFQSPTCTPRDEQAARALAVIAGAEIEALFEEMIRAGEDLSGKTPEEIFLQDYKSFTSGAASFGVGQGNFFSRANRAAVRDALRQHLPDAVAKQGVSMVFYMLTSPADKSSEILFAGKGAEELLRAAFHLPAVDGVVTLPGVLSRKQQFLPSLIKALRES